VTVADASPDMLSLDALFEAVIVKRKEPFNDLDS
jgi:hypothetical protein